MRITKNLTFQVLVAIVLGVIVGQVWPKFGQDMKVVGETFINLIKMVIAPIIFLTIVIGISSMGDMKKVGRVGGKALLYFEVVTTFALFIGIIVANLVKPGAGLDPEKLKKGDIAKYVDSAKDMDWVQFFTHIVPSNVFEAFAKGDILQILFFSVLFGLGLTMLGDTGKPVISFFDKLSKIFFNILGMVMKLAPIGAFGGMAYTIGKFGIATLKPLSMLMVSVYGTMFLFVFVVLNIIAKLYGFSLWKYLSFIKEELLLVLGTSSSESALPGMMNKMERFGCSKPVVGLVIPTGYSFNLDGTTIYLSMATIFLAQVFHVDLSIAQQLTIIAILMLTSKGAAAVTGGGFIVLASTLTAMQVIPIEGLALLLGVDRFMSEARAIVNLIGNGVATIVVAKSEKEFDESKHQEALVEMAQPKLSA
ncbi:Na+/H+-dicarboxylate symporter [Aneurinibacillus soli]|uniref:C4-dicarboxylate transport protein n=1 Tax=Aneurinibacillus soli TaxID=1500254 RepID=A0A0U5BG68_9BACL|nr:dicarboxylate/amino acid:cation symporter [Aneurinibacillus soli]PYE62620.1 Na+/H+-dicarboxylate symporter [Aneurinibacillus soli]BAU27182.1 C4-dicarboxylate transport protein [Aneurinibacillus soli]